MNGFLVMVRFTDADVPVGLFLTRADADHFALNLSAAQISDVRYVLYHVGGDPLFVYLIEMRDGNPCEPRQIKRVR